MHNRRAVAHSHRTSAATSEIDHVHGTVELVESVIDDTRSLVGAHLEALRDDLGEQVSALGAAVSSSLVAFSLIVVTALLVGIALANSLVAVGVPSWAAFWIVATAVAALGGYLALRARRNARTTGAAAAECVKDEIARISNEPQHE